MKKCKACGEVNTSDSQFCENCGKGEFVFSEDILCPHCGLSNDVNATHCVNCGNSIVQVVATVESVASNRGNELVATDNVIAPIDGEDVETVKSEIKQVYEKDLARPSVKETIQCPNCGTELQINSMFCYKCGTTVAKLNENKVVSRKMCQQCHTPNLLSNATCTYCYSSLTNAPMEEFQLIHVPIVIGKTIVKQAVLQGNEGKYLMCNNCGALNSTSDTFCVHCGLSLVVESQPRYCLNCGAENEDDAQFCHRCQWSFEGVAPSTYEGVWGCNECNHINNQDDQYCVHCGSARVTK